MTSWPNQQHAISVDLMALKAVPPVFLKGRAVFDTPRSCTVDLLSDAPGLRVGLDLVLDAAAEAGCRVVGTITEVEARRIRVSVDHMVRTDLRVFPRMWGGISVRYRAATSPDEANPWLRGEGLAGTWHCPEPYMDFSASGLRFEDAETCRKDDLVLLEFRVPFHDPAWRATARVVRIAPLSADDLEDVDPDVPRPTHEVAVQFVEVPPEAVDALVDFTGRLQEVFV
jgi:hypothetical protein